MSDPAVPFEGYDDLTVSQVTDRLAQLGEDEIDQVKAYEKANQNRKGIVEFGTKQQPASEAFQPKGRPPLAEVAEQAAADEVVEIAGEEQ